MLASVKWRLTVVFVLVTTIVYVATSTAGIARFWLRMNNELDDEISTLATDAMTHVTYKSSVPTLDMEPVRFHQHVSIQLYDTDGKLLQLVGDDGAKELSKNTNEVNGKEGIHYRSRAFALPNTSGLPSRGFVQVQISTHQRDQAIKNYVEIFVILSPLLLLVLALAGVYFARWAMRPREQAMVALRRFLADSSHELGTPLAILRTTADNLSLDVNGMPEAEERVETITRSVERMSKLVNDMTHLARLETAQLSIDMKSVHIDEIVKETVDHFKELFAEKQLAITCTAENAVIKGDKAAIERLLVNLLQNAMRYTDPGGKVEVSLTAKDNSAVLTVSDTGIGIPDEALPHIFERFYRVEKARSRAEGGSGLGLAIVKFTAVAHGGDVSVKSKEGAGTKFTVTFPLVSRS